MTHDSQSIPDSLKKDVIEQLNKALSHLREVTLRTENLNDLEIHSIWTPDNEQDALAAYDETVEADITITVIRNILQRCWFGNHSK